MSIEDCKDVCSLFEEKCVDDCNNVMSRQECRKLEYCTWHLGRYWGDDGRCIWRKEENYSCSDIKRYSECSNGENIYILNDKCEYYKGKCHDRCGLYLNIEKCLMEGKDYCVWDNNITEGDINGRCILKVYYYIYFNYIYIYVCVCVCVRACVRCERETETGRMP
jgi:hypothetical protein